MKTCYIFIDELLYLYFHYKNIIKIALVFVDLQRKTLI